MFDILKANVNLFLNSKNRNMDCLILNRLCIPEALLHR